jgi:SAM-dependent methyltransferase
MAQYVFDHNWKKERARLANIERMLDPFTIQRLESFGVGAGWRCLEVGAGGGSIAEWLCGKVGPHGRVVATDLQTKFLEALQFPNLEVRRHDILRDGLETASFDLITARKVLEHLPNPALALRRLVVALRPGGWILVEDADFVSFMCVSAPRPELFRQAAPRFIEAMVSAGYQPYFGRELGCQMRNLGLSPVHMEGRTGEWNCGGTQPSGSLFKLTFERLRDRVVEAGLLSAQEADQFLTDIQSPEFTGISPISFAAWGQKKAKNRSDYSGSQT